MPSSRITSLLEGLQFTPPSSARTKVHDTRYYVRITYVLPGTYTNIFFLIFLFMRYTGVCFFSLSGVCTTLCDTRYVLYRYLFIRAWVVVRMRAWFQQAAVSLVGGGTHDTYVPPKKQLYRRGYPMKSHSAADARQDQLQKESYRLSSTCGAPRNHTNVPPVDTHV